MDNLFNLSAHKAQIESLVKANGYTVTDEEYAAKVEALVAEITKRVLAALGK